MLVVVGDTNRAPRCLSSPLGEQQHVFRRLREGRPQGIRRGAGSTNPRSFLSCKRVTLCVCGVNLLILPNSYTHHHLLRVVAHTTLKQQGTDDHRTVASAIAGGEAQAFKLIWKAFPGNQSRAESMGKNVAASNNPVTR